MSPIAERHLGLVLAAAARSPSESLEERNKRVLEALERLCDDVAMDVRLEAERWEEEMVW